MDLAFFRLVCWIGKHKAEESKDQAISNLLQIMPFYEVQPSKLLLQFSRFK